MTLSSTNPSITTVGSYITIPNGIYVSGGTPYFQTQIQARAGIHNDTGAYLTINGGTSNISYFTGNVGIGTTNPGKPLDVIGNIRTSGSIYISTAYSGATANVCYYTDGAGSFYLATCASSRKYKTDIQDLVLPNEEERLMSLRPVSYRLKRTGEADIGLIAEEVAETMPELSIFNDEGPSRTILRVTAKFPRHHWSPRILDIGGGGPGARAP